MDNYGRTKGKVGVLTHLTLWIKTSSRGLFLCLQGHREVVIMLLPRQWMGMETSGNEERISGRDQTCKGNTEAGNNMVLDDQGKTIEVCRVLINDCQVM